MTTLSLRRAALIWMTVLLALVGFVTIAVAYAFAYQNAAEFLDGQLRQVALNAGLGEPAAAAPQSEDLDPEDRLAVTIWDAAGRLVHASLADVSIPRLTKPGFDKVSAGGESWRVYTLIGPQGAVEVAQRETVLQEIAESAALGAAAPILIVIPLSWIVVGWAMNRMTRHLNDLARDLGDRSVSADEPVPLAGVPVEVAPLVVGMNGLILRLRTALDAQKRFLADAANELRTPLAAMQIQLDNLRGADAEARAQGLAALSAGVRRAGTLVGQLLRLARLEDATASSLEPVDIATILLECIATAAPIAEHKVIDIEASVASPALTRGNSDEVRTLFANLLDNALRYTPGGGKVDVILSERNGRRLAEIIDTGCGIPPGEDERIFERFHRAAASGRDRAGDSTPEGSGLGLAIAARIAARHGFTLTVENRRDGARGVVARVIMPAAGGGADPDGLIPS